MFADWMFAPVGPTKLRVVERAPTLTMSTSSVAAPPASRKAWLSRSGAA